MSDDIITVRQYIAIEIGKAAVFGFALGVGAIGALFALSRLFPIAG